MTSHGDSPACVVTSTVVAFMILCPAALSPLCFQASPELRLFSLRSAPPRFTRTPEDQTGVQGGVASFVCQAAGDPQPKIIWNKKGKKVSNQRFEVHCSFVSLPLLSGVMAVWRSAAPQNNLCSLNLHVLVLLGSFDRDHRDPTA